MEDHDDYRQSPQNEIELYARIEREWDRLEKAINSLSEEEMNVPDEGGWSIKDNLAHLMSWERFMRLCYLEKVPAYQAMDIEEGTFKQLDEKGINAVLHRRHKDRPLSEIMAERRDEHAQVMAALKSLTFQQMMQPLDPKDPQKRPLLNWITGNTYEHYMEHRATIERIGRL